MNLEDLWIRVLIQI